jgi:hypothetical protein
MRWLVTARVGDTEQTADGASSDRSWAVITLMDDELARLQHAEHLAWAARRAQLALLTPARDPATWRLPVSLSRWLATWRQPAASRPHRAGAWETQPVAGDGD